MATWVSRVTLDEARAVTLLRASQIAISGRVELHNWLSVCSTYVVTQGDDEAVEYGATLSGRTGVSQEEVDDWIYKAAGDCLDKSSTSGSKPSWGLEDGLFPVGLVG